jgi:hypothetical protein
VAFKTSEKGEKMPLYIVKEDIKNLKCLPEFIYNIDPSKLTHVIINELV